MMIEKPEETFEILIDLFEETVFFVTYKGIHIVGGYTVNFRGSERRKTLSKSQYQNLIKEQKKTNLHKLIDSLNESHKVRIHFHP